MEATKLDILRKKFKKMKVDYIQNRPRVLDNDNELAWKDMTEYTKKRFILDYLHSKGIYEHTRESIAQMKFASIKYNPKLKKIIDIKFEYKQ